MTRPLVCADCAWRFSTLSLKDVHRLHAQRCVFRASGTRWYVCYGDRSDEPGGTTKTVHRLKTVPNSSDLAGPAPFVEKAPVHLRRRAVHIAPASTRSTRSTRATHSDEYKHHTCAQVQRHTYTHLAVSADSLTRTHMQQHLCSRPRGGPSRGCPAGPSRHIRNTADAPSCMQPVSAKACTRPHQGHAGRARSTPHYASTTHPPHAGLSWAAQRQRRPVDRAECGGMARRSSWMACER